MSGGTVGPALAQFEWADVHSERGVFIRDAFHVVPRHEGGFWTHLRACLGAEDRHALAALALHGQPFGFTHEDVKMLRAVRVNLLAEYGKLHPHEEGIATAHDDLADRIEALLPPEKP